jgi:hypothetical protein
MKDSQLDDELSFTERHDDQYWALQKPKYRESMLQFLAT